MRATYHWGPDISESLQGAGGVGGLVLMRAHWTLNGQATESYVPGYDGNGNVVTLWNSATGTQAAQYEYDPFGELLKATGPVAEANPFRFSTKYTDGETGLVYYGYRYYAPNQGRWPSRDPLGEPGHELLVNWARRLGARSRPAELQRAPNLFAFARNDPGFWIDPDGRALWGPPFFPPSPPPNPKPDPDEIDYPWYVDAFGAACDIASVVSICFDIATIPSGEGAAATVCLQACKQSAKNKIKHKIACDALYEAYKEACDVPGCNDDGLRGAVYVARAMSAASCARLRAAWLKKCACKGQMGGKATPEFWKQHWAEVGKATAKAMTCFHKAKAAGWPGEIPSLP